ncbi:putative sac3 ganp domain protein [Rosellinia necatrix]|uniref:Putative sac3 ganp domain protein n=1 Tax=Rosellinia necatrix TaxID=77044 RepID=A0A1W2TVW9_ROSNE|nr:putative sac3 ganp domain protein [Rosellinia necatrix]
MSWAVPHQPGIQPAPYYSQPITTAFTPVSIRQGFARAYQSEQQYPYIAPANPPQPSNTMPPPPSDQQQQQKFDWPQSVRNYVQRTFQASNEIPGVGREEKESRLKEIIRSEQEKGTMFATNWDEMPLPQQLIQRERQQALISVDSATTQPQTPSFTGGSKKRKSSDFSEPEQTNGSAVPWRSTKALSLEDRVSKAPSDKRLLMDGPLTGKSKFQKHVEKRQRRGDGGYQSSYRSPSPPPTSGPIVGLNTNLEKRYLRLTAAPKREDVRPETVLQQTLDLLKRKWRKENNYNYICDQFKSLRQDLTVQHVRNEFTVSVYEIHARIALEKGDLGEYNQCQTQLRALYRAGIKGNPIEFKAYRILYFIHTANRTALNDAIADLTTAEKEELPVKHALSVRSALALGNYHKFFQLYLDVPNMGAYLMDMFIKRERLAALTSMCKAFKPELKLRYVTEELAFESDAEAAQFIIDYDEELLQERDDHIVFLTGKAGQVFENAKAQAFSRVDLKGQI